MRVDVFICPDSFSLIFHALCVISYFICYLYSYIHAPRTGNSNITACRANNIGMILLFSIPNLGYFDIARNRAACYARLPPKRYKKGERERERERHAGIVARPRKESSLLLLPDFSLFRNCSPSEARRSSKPAPRRLLAERVIGTLSRIPARSH